MKRDPRVEPKAGDVLRTSQRTVLILFVDCQDVLYASTGPIGTFWGTRPTYRKWAAKAKVIYAAD